MFCHLSMSTKIPTLSRSSRKEERGPEGVRIHSLVFLEVVKKRTTYLSKYIPARQRVRNAEYVHTRSFKSA
jgi:hypothetical protein